MLGAWDMEVPLREFSHPTHEQISRNNIFEINFSIFCYCNAANLTG
jgi:hypothetical protein